MYKKGTQVRRLKQLSSMKDTSGGVFMKLNLNAEQYLEKVLSTDVIDEKCPVHRTLNILSGKWRTHIIFELCKHNSLRFGELKKSIPAITNSMLTSTLRDLEKLGIIYREQFNEIPPHVEYSLTTKGKELIPVFVEISKWGETNLD